MCVASAVKMHIGSVPVCHAQICSNSQITATMGPVPRNKSCHIQKRKAGELQITTYATWHQADYYNNWQSVRWCVTSTSTSVTSRSEYNYQWNICIPQSQTMKSTGQRREVEKDQNKYTYSVCRPNQSEGDHAHRLNFTDRQTSDSLWISCPPTHAAMLLFQIY